jgi:hypothetical protein
MSLPYVTHFLPIDHTTNTDSVFMYIGNYNHNTITVKNRNFGLFERMKTEATKFIDEFKQRREELKKISDQ